MKIKKVDMVVIIGIIVCVIVFLTIEKNKTAGKTFEDIVRKLDSPARYECEQAAVILGRADPLIVLEDFKQEFRYLSHEARVSFAKKVVPKMAGEQVDSFFLNELRAGLKVHEEIERLKPLVEEGMRDFEFAATAKELYELNQWWMWVIRSRSDLSYVPSYDEIYRMFIKSYERGFPFQFARALHARDSSRAEGDFTNLLFDPNRQMKLRGIWALEAIRFVPVFEVIHKFFESADVSLLDQSDQYIRIFGRKDLELLLSLVGSPSTHVSGMAEYRLRKIAYLTPDEKNHIMANATTPQQRADVWRSWWEQHKDDSDQILRKRAVSVLINKSEEQLTKKTLEQMAEYPEQNEIYPFFRKALFSGEKDLQTKALEQLSYIAARKKSTIAVDIIVNFCEKLSPNEHGEYAGYLVRIDDERARSLLLKMLETQRGEDTRWRRILARSIGMTGQNWALGPLVNMIIEDGSSNAAGVITFVEGSESAVPRLLDALLKQEDHNERYPIVKAIRTTGAEDLPIKLTKILLELPGQAVPTFKGGIRFDVLKLMESFPDPNAKPALLELLKSENPWDNLGAARVLGKLGDDSGVDVLIKYIKRPTKISATFSNNRIGDALQMIGSSKTKKLLEKHFKRGDLDVKKRTLHVMAQQLDSAYISFIEKQLKSSEPEIVSAACSEISYLIRTKLDNENKYRQMDDFDIDILTEDDLQPVRTMLLWAFFDTQINENSTSFPNHRSLTKLDGAVIRVNRYQQIEFNKSEKSLKLTTPKSQSVLTTRDGIKAGRQQLYAEGSIERSILGEYMTISLNLNYGGASYLFKREGKNWKAIGYLGGVIR